MHPAAQVLHYGMCCFEGMKAYHGVDGRGRLFRQACPCGKLLMAHAHARQLHESESHVP